MRQLCYGVAATLDGFIAGPNGEYDWIVRDPTIDFAAMFAPYDTLLMGRGTYQVASAEGKSWDSFGQRWFIVSTTLKPEDHPKVTILSSGVAQAVAALKAQPGKGIWLFGGLAHARDDWQWNPAITQRQALPAQAYGEHGTAERDSDAQICDRALKVVDSPKARTGIPRLVW